jgi:hypothetical protein
MLRRFLVLIAICLTAQPALGGAFLQRPGMVLAIQELRFSGSLQAFDSRGRLRPVASYQKFTLDTALEYGLTDWVTLLARLEAASVFNEGPPAAFYRGLGMSELGARVELWGSRDRSLIFSAQAMARWPGAGAGNAAASGMTAVETDWRLMAGGSFDVRERAGFWSIEGGLRKRSGPEPDEARLELATGLQVFDLLQVIVQGFHILIPRTPLNLHSQSHKAQLSLLFNPGRAWSLQAGAFRTLAGVNARQEKGLAVAFWRRM